MRKLTLLITALFLSVGMAWAQLADGVYTINNAINNRGTMCFGTSGGTEYLGLTGITYTGLSGKSVTVTEDANKYWYVQTVNGTTYIYNIGKGVFLKDSGADVATSDSNCNGFTLVTKSSGGTSYISVMNGSRYLTFSPGYDANNGQVRWRTQEEADAVYLTFNLVDNGTTTYKTQVTAAKSKILLSTANETGAVYTIEGGSLTEHRGFLAAGEGYNDYPVLSEIAWSSHSSKSTPAIDNGKNWYVYRKAENEWCIYNVALEKFLAAEDGNINFSPFPYSWVIAENTQGGVNYLVIKDASDANKGVSFACGTTPRNVKHYYQANDGGSMHIFTPAQGDFSAQIAANVKAKLNMPAPGSYIRIKSVATEAYLSSVNHATQTTRAAYVADADVTTIFKIDGTSLYSYASRQYLVNKSNFLGYGSTESGATIEFQAANVSLNLENAYSIKLFGENRWLYAHANNYTDAGNGNNDDNYSFYIEEVTELPVAHINNVGYATLEDAKAAALATTDAVEIVLLAETDATIIFPANVTIDKNGFTADNLAVAVAKIGETLYASIEAALADATEGATITLLADVTCAETPVFNNGGVVNVDINGHVLVSNEQGRIRNVASADGTVASNNIKFVSGFGWEVYLGNGVEGANFRVFPTLNEAVAYIPASERVARIYLYENIQLENDVTLRKYSGGTSSTICVEPGYEITLDLNGYTVLQESPTGNPLEACIRGSLVLDDTSEAKTGKWIAGACGVTDTENEDWYGGGGPAFYVLGDGELILKGGTVSIARNTSMNSNGEPVVNKGGLIRLDSGSLTVDGATLKCDDTCGVMAWGGNVVVNSGEFVMGEKGVYSVFASKYYADASVEVNTAIDGYLHISPTATATVNAAGVKYVADGTNTIAPAVGEGLVAQGGVVGYPVAKIGETGYLTLEAAVAAAQVGDEIVLLSDVELTESLVIAEGKTITLNLNGKTVDVAWEDEEAGKHIYALTNYGTLTVTGNGTINTRGIYNYGAMTLTSGTINAIDGNGGYGVCNYDGATFTMDGGTIATTLEDDNKVDKGGYDATPVRVEEGATFTMNGGVINNICDFTVAINNYGTTIINNGEATTVHTTLANSGTMTINGGEFTCNGIEGITAHALWAAAGETTINGGTFNGKDNFNGFNVDASEGAVVNITGGTFLAVHSGSLYGEGTITVSGGTFFDAVPADRCADGFVPKANGDGTYGVVADPNYIAEFIIDDAARVDYDNDTDKTVGTLTYKRTLAEGAWNPLYLPFQVDVAQLADNYDIAYYNQMLSSDSNNDGAFDSYIMEVAYITSGTLRANYPYFIRPKTSDDCYLEYVANDVTLYAAIEKVIETFSVANTFRLHGTHKTVSAADLAGCYTIKASGWVQTTIDLRPHRLYLEILENNNSPFVPAAAKSIRIVVRGEDDEDGTTGIDGIYGDENGETVIFDLYGRRVLEPEKGNIYIINGKKVLVK